MLELGKLFGGDSESFGRIAPAELADLRGQVEAISRSQAVIEFELNGVIRNANQNFLLTVGYTLDEIRGQHHRIFVDPAHAESADYHAFWQKLGQGRYDAGVYKRFGKGRREIWLQATYNPIVDASGRPLKVVKYASDITDQKVQEPAKARARKVA